MGNKQLLQSAGDGTAVPAGYVGEKIETSAFSDYTCTLSEADVPGASITLTPGVWRIFYSVAINITTGASTSNATNTRVKITNSANTLVGNTTSILYAKNTGTVAYLIISQVSSEAIVTPATNTTYKLRAYRTDDNGTGSSILYGVASVFGQATFYAVRIA